MRNLLSLLLAACLVAGCQETARAPAVSMYEYGRISALAGLTAKFDDPAPAPDDKPKPGDKCQACNGTGKVGDGRVETKCLDCNGTGRVQPSAVLEAAPPARMPVGGHFVPNGPSKRPYAAAHARHKADGKPLVVLITASWCQPCKLLASKMRRLDLSGVHYLELDYQDTDAAKIKRGTLVPQLVVYAASPSGEYRNWRLVGDKPVGTLQETVAAAERHTTVSTSISLPDSLAYPRWTYPGEIRQHLRQAHGVDASGMTRAEAERLHNKLHNAARKRGRR